MEQPKDGVFSRNSETLALFLSLKSKNLGKHIKVIQECYLLLALQWIYFNLFTVSLQTVKRCLKWLFENYRGLKKYSSRSEYNG